MKTSHCLSLLLFIISALAPIRVIAADPEFPNKPIRFIVAYPPGGSNDAVARVLAQKMNDGSRQPIFVENKPGASGFIGAEFVAKSSPDGHTIMIISDSIVINPLLNRNIKFDVRQNLAPITLLSKLTYVLIVNPSVRARDLQELVTLARSRPGMLNYSSTGMGSTGQILMEAFTRSAGVNMTHVPYSGGNTATMAVFSNDAQVTVMSVATGLPYIKAGKVRALGMLSSERDMSLPEVHTMSELGFRDLRTPWLGIFAAPKTPGAIIDSLNTLLVHATLAPDTRAKLQSQGLEMVASSAEEFRRFIEENTVFYEKLIRDANIQAE